MATDEQLKVIESLARLGFTQHYISGVLDVSTTTLSRWKQENPEVATALNVSQDGLLQDVKSRMYKTAITGSDKDSNSAAAYLLNRYEKSEPIEAGQSLSDLVDEAINDAQSDS